jgi:DNA-binding NtrC family response regulator
VEDDDGVREFAQEVLSRAGYRVQAARNGIDALEQTRANDLAIDVLVTDVVMPEMGGRELAQHLRRRRPDLPILYITGYTDDARMLGELYSTEARLLEKPFTASALEMAVEEVAEGSSRTPAPI